MYLEMFVLNKNNFVILWLWGVGLGFFFSLVCFYYKLLGISVTENLEIQVNNK